MVESSCAAVSISRRMAAARVAGMGVSKKTSLVEGIW